MIGVYIGVAIVAYFLGSISFSVIFSRKFAGFDVREKGMFKNATEKIKCAVCPECGYTETYIDNTDKIRKLIEKDR